MFRGREMAYQQKGRDLLQKVSEDIGAQGNVEQKPTMEGRNMIMMVTPKPVKA